MKIRILIAAVVLAGGFALVQSGDGAKARAPLMCRMQNGSTQPVNAQNSAPLILSATGTSYTNQGAASNAALSAWSQQASSFGGQYASWSNARQKNVNCWSSKPMFQWIYTCKATGQPCG